MKRRFKFPSIPKEYIIILLTVGLLFLKCIKIDSWTDWALGSIIGMLIGVKMEQIRGSKK